MQIDFRYANNYNYYVAGMKFDADAAASGELDVIYDFDLYSRQD